MTTTIKCPDCGKMMKVTIEEVALPTVTVTKKTSADSSWAEIAKRIRSGESDLKVGDEITFADADGDLVTVQVAHLNPYAENEVAFVLKDCWKAEHEMNEENTNDGGWKESAMRKWLNGEVFNSLPEELRSVIKTREVRQDLGGNALSVSYDKLWLLSRKEVADYDAGSDADDIWFEIFDGEKSRVKSYGDQTYPYWLRSPYAGNTAIFQYVGSDGNVNAYNASNSYGVAFGFLI